MPPKKDKKSNQDEKDAPDPRLRQVKLFTANAHPHTRSHQYPTRQLLREDMQMIMNAGRNKDINFAKGAAVHLWE